MGGGKVAASTICLQLVLGHYGTGIEEQRDGGQQLQIPVIRGSPAKGCALPRPRRAWGEHSLGNLILWENGKVKWGVHQHRYTARRADKAEGKVAAGPDGGGWRACPALAELENTSQAGRQERLSSRVIRRTPNSLCPGEG